MPSIKSTFIYTLLHCSQLYVWQFVTLIKTKEERNMSIYCTVINHEIFWSASQTWAFRGVRIPVLCTSIQITTYSFISPHLNTEGKMEQGGTKSPQTPWWTYTNILYMKENFCITEIIYCYIFISIPTSIINSTLLGFLF